jgi:hypothetical protein
LPKLIFGCCDRRDAFRGHAASIQHMSSVPCVPSCDL